MKATIFLIGFLFARTASAQNDNPLFSGDEASRIAEVFVMSQSTMTNAVRLDALLRQLPREDSQHVRLAMVKALSKPNFHGESALLALGRAIQNDLSDKVRSAAAAALMSYEGPNPIDYINRALGTEQGEDVRLAFCLALSSGGVHRDDPAVTDSLSQIVNEDPSAAMRLCAVKALAGRGDRRVLPLLSSTAAHDEDASVRKEAKNAFARMFVQSKKPAPAKPKPKPMETVDSDGRLHCGSDGGICQCTNGVITPTPHCMTLEECQHLYETSYQNEGSFGCTWDGQDVEQQR